MGIFDRKVTRPEPAASTVPPAPKTGVCRYCRHDIVYEPGPSGSFWMTPIGEQPPAPAALPNECPALPRPGMGPGSFERHEPR